VSVRFQEEAIRMRLTSISLKLNPIGVAEQELGIERTSEVLS